MILNSYDVTLAGDRCCCAICGKYLRLKMNKVNENYKILNNFHPVYPRRWQRNDDFYKNLLGIQLARKKCICKFMVNQQNIDMYLVCPLQWWI